MVVPEDIRRPNTPAKRRNAGTGRPCKPTAQKKGRPGGHHPIGRAIAPLG